MSQQPLEQELTVGEIVKIYLSHWRMFLFFTLGLFLISSVVYVFKVPYIGSAKIVVNDSQNSAMQAFSSQYYGLSKSVQESKKNGSSLLSKHLEYLKTRDFYEALLSHIEVRGQSTKITMEEQQGFQEFKDKYLKAILTPAEKISVLQFLDRATKTQLDSDFELKVTVSTPSKSLSLFLTNAVAELAADKLKERESEEINRVEAFMQSQKDDADKKLNSFSKELAQLQGQDESVMPLASQEKMGDYLSDLLVRANELKLKIEENKKSIDYLMLSKSSQRESALYGVGGKIEALRIENSMLAGKLSQVQVSISQVKKQVKQLPYKAALVEDLKKKSELEFARFKDASNALGKIEAQKVSIDNRFEVFESARWDSTGPQISLMTLGFLSVLLSQVLGSLLIYFRYLWNPSVITARASRNIMIFDHESDDPRVIFENSKIKFSLNAAADKESEEAKEIAWKLSKWDKSSDLPQ